jgi:medium-chain acyl-[acyl-carrier-protein] hydrolase
MSKTSVTNSPKASWFLCYRQLPNAKLRLFCFPYAGGGALIYRPWVDHLPTSVEAHLVQPPGRGGRLREAPFTSIEPMIESIASAILQYLDRPFAFFGHSMGAVIAFELARRLKREFNKEPACLFLSARRAPQLPDGDVITYNLPEPEFIDELRRLNGTPKEVFESPELLQLLLPVLRADFEVCQTYRFTEGAPLDCPISVYGGLQDEEVLQEHLDAWREQTTSSFTSHMFPGDHFFLHTCQSMLLRTLSVRLHNLIQKNGAPSGYLF